jgi:hypothetical protein
MASKSSSNESISSEEQCEAAFGLQLSGDMKKLFLALILISHFAVAAEVQIVAKPDGQKEYRVEINNQPGISISLSNGGINVTPPIPNSLTQLAGVNIGAAKTIVLFTLNPNLGDNLIFQYSQIPYLHKINPTAEIHVISPTSFVLEESEWLKPKTIDVKKFFDVAFVETLKADPDLISNPIINVLENSITQGSVVLWNEDLWGRFRKELLGTFKKGHGNKEPTTEQQNLVGSQIVKIWDSLKVAIQSRESEGFGAQILDGPPRITVVIPRSHEIPLFAKQENSAGVYGFQVVPTKWLSRNSPPYETAIAWNQTLYGENAFSAWNEDNYIAEDSIPSAKKWLVQNLTYPERPYIVVNLNTQGKIKVHDLKSDYSLRVFQLVSEIQNKYPRLNILISAPEPQFGTEVARSVRNTVDSLNRGGSEVVFLPPDKKLWNPLLKGASFVLSQDSGFAHLAYVFNENVLTFSRDIWKRNQGKDAVSFMSGLNEGELYPVYVGQAERWKKPGTKSVSISRASLSKENHAALILEWADQCKNLLKAIP